MIKTLIKLTCPECRGPLWEEKQGRIVEYRCRVGHVFSPLALSNEHQITVERAMWSTIVALEEAADILETAGDEQSLTDAAFRREQVVALKETLRKMNAASETD